METQGLKEPVENHVQIVEKLELQLPTRLRGDYVSYQAEPQWRSTQNNKSLFSMPGRADRRWDSYSYQLYEQAKAMFAVLPESEKQKVMEFRKKKTKFFSQFTTGYYNVVRLLVQGNILGIEKTDEEGDISFRIISEHSAVVGATARELSTAMADELLREKVEREGIDPQTVNENSTKLKEQAIREVVVGSLLQDINKRMEIDFQTMDAIRQLQALKALVHQGYGSEDDIQTVTLDPSKTAVIYEKLLQLKRVDDYKKRDLFSRYGNIETIIACATSSGMPVVTLQKNEDGHYLPTLAQRIANFADKMVQDTGLVINLERRHQLCVQRYSPKELVDEEFRYAEQCAEEFAQLMGLKSGEEIPLYLLNNLFRLINAQKN